MLNEFNDIVRLIDLVRNRPGLYNNTLGERNNKAVVDSLWIEVAAELKTTPGECRRKWASLRCALTREIRKEMEVEEGSKGKKRRWYLSTHLSFLRKYLNTKFYKVIKGPFVPDEAIEEELDCSIDENKSFFNFSNEDVENESVSSKETKTLDNTKSLASVNSSMVKDIKQIAASPPPPPLTPPQPSDESKHHYMIDSETSYSKRRRLNDSIKIEDQNMTFFKSIIPDVLRLSERQQRLYKQNVLKKLNQILDEQEF